VSKVVYKQNVSLKAGFVKEGSQERLPSPAL
jgi:hypothetical protein